MLNNNNATGKSRRKESRSHRESFISGPRVTVVPQLAVREGKRGSYSSSAKKKISLNVFFVRITPFANETVCV